MKDDDADGAGQAGRDQEVRLHRRRSRRRADEDGEARRGDRRLDGRRPRSPSAPCSAGRRSKNIFGVVPCTVMSMMSDEPDVERLRSGYLRRRRHARAAAGVAKRPARCSTGTTTTATIPTRPSASTAATCPSISSRREDGFPGRSSPARWASENTFGTCVGQVKAEPDELRPLLHRRSATGTMRGYVGEGEFTDDPLEDVRRRGRGRDSATAGAAALHLRERLRASRGRQLVDRRRRGARSHDAVSGLGRAITSSATRIALSRDCSRVTMSIVAASISER